jgi:transcriptional regulator of arginine metabolism
VNEYRSGGAQRRQQAILDVIRSGVVRSQGDLQHRLRKRGIAVAQPTLSRDVRELGLAKTPRGYVSPGDTIAPLVPTELRESRLDRALRGFALSVQAAGSLVVVKTPPAGAQPVARALDEAAMPAVAGTIAGDDTVFVATGNERAARSLARRLAASLMAQPARVGA